MVDALSRLFGKSSKKGSPPSPSDPSSANEDDGFTMVGGPTLQQHQPRPGEEAADWFAGGGGQQHQYPALPNQDNTQPPLPYDIRPLGAGAGGGGAGGGGGVGGDAAYPPSFKSQTSVTHVLDAVPFALKTSLSSGRGGRQLEGLLRDVEDHLEAAQSLIDQASAQDFRLERNIVEAETDVSGTLSRLHAS